MGLCQAGAEQMAAKGAGYREILAFYYPGTNVATRATVAWQTRKSDHFDAQVTSDADAAVLDLAERLLAEVEADTGWKLVRRPAIQVFPTLDAYRSRFPAQYQQLVRLARPSPSTAPLDSAPPPVSSGARCKL